MSADELLLFAPSESLETGRETAVAAGITLARHEERDFADGEHKIRPLENVAGRDVYLLQALHGDSRFSVNDKLCRLLFFAGALRDAGAGRLTLLLPYLCYARKDRRTKARDPVTHRYVAQLIESIGADRVVGLDVHNRAAFDNGFRRPSVHLTAKRLFARHFAALAGSERLVVVSPDTGGAKRAEAFRLALSERSGSTAGSAFIEKYRSGGEVRGNAVVGDVEDAVAVILDDLVSTGGTLVRAARACRERGARRVYGAATHGVFVEGAGPTLADPALDAIVVTSSVAGAAAALGEARAKLAVLPVGPLLGETVRRLHADESIVELT